VRGKKGKIMLSKIQSNINTNRQSFKSKESTLYEGLDKSVKPLNKFIKSQENLSSTRFIQDVVTNWIPKVVFTRSLADFTEMTFLEYTESALFYFAPALLGGLFHKLFSKLNPKELRKDLDEHVVKSADDLLKAAKDTKATAAAKRALPVKAAILLACVSIPATEFALSFAKNLLTLKVFKKSNFNNVVNLNKDSNQAEDKEQQEKVRKSAYKHIKHAGLLSLCSFAGALVLAKFGHKSQALQKVSEAIVKPSAGIAKVLEKLGLKGEKLEKTKKALSTYISFDFKSENGKLGLSKGQLVVSTLSGLWGYSEAGKDRGRLDQLEVLTRVPLVVFYTIFGSALFDNIFKKVLLNKDKYSDLVKKTTDGSINIPNRADLPALAEKIAKQKGTTAQSELNRLVKEKAVITAVPYGFSLVFMGFLLAGITRFWTQYRFDQAKREKIDEKLNNYFPRETNFAGKTWG
jgi:hypothetical protein